MKVYITIIFLLTTLFGYNQSKFSSVVIDINNNPINNVVIRNINTKKVTTSNPNGSFIIEIKHDTTVLEFYHQSYEKTIRVITNSNIKLNTEIILNEKSIELESFTISSSIIKPVFNKSNISVIDYDFLNPYTLVMYSEKRSNYLLLKHDEKHIDSVKIDQKPKKLFRDCLGNIHVIYKDYFNQVYLQNEKLTLGNNESLSLLETNLAPCKCSSENNLYLAFYHNKNQAVSFYVGNRKTNTSRFFNLITDKESLKSIKYYENKIASNPIGSPVSNLNVRTLGMSRQKLQDVFWKESILEIPTYNPLFFVKDSLYIFNHVNSTLDIFNENGNYSRSVSIGFYEDQNYQKQIIFDYETSKCYALSKIGGTYIIGEINLITGKIIYKTYLQKHKSPENIKIWSGEVYYKYYNKSGNQFFKLYKQGL